MVIVDSVIVNQTYLRLRSYCFLGIAWIIVLFINFCLRSQCTAPKQHGSFSCKQSHLKCNSALTLWLLAAIITKKALSPVYTSNHSARFCTVCCWTLHFLSRYPSNQQWNLPNSKWDQSITRILLRARRHFFLQFLIEFIPPVFSPFHKWSFAANICTADDGGDDDNDGDSVLIITMFIILVP